MVESIRFVLYAPVLTHCLLILNVQQLGERRVHRGIQKYAPGSQKPLTTPGRVPYAAAGLRRHLLHAL